MYEYIITHTYGSTHAWMHTHMYGCTNVQVRVIEAHAAQWDGTDTPLAMYVALNPNPNPKP